MASHSRDPSQVRDVIYRRPSGYVPYVRYSQVMYYLSALCSVEHCFRSSILSYNGLALLLIQ